MRRVDNSVSESRRHHLQTSAKLWERGGAAAEAALSRTREVDDQLFLGATFQDVSLEKGLEPAASADKHQNKSAAMRHPDIYGFISLILPERL